MVSSSVSHTFASPHPKGHILNSQQTAPCSRVKSFSYVSTIAQVLSSPGALALALLLETLPFLYSLSQNQPLHLLPSSDIQQGRIPSAFY